MKQTEREDGGGPIKPLSEAETAELRHGWRTSVNHILGYSEMMLEEAGDAPRAASLLRDIRSAANDALETIDAAPAGALRSEDLLHIRRALGEEAARIQDSVKRLENESVGPKQRWSDDLKRIAAAASELIEEDRPGKDRPEHRDTEPGAAATAQPGTPKVLIVDDNAGNRAILRRRLEPEGYAIEDASNGVEALERLRADEFDLVLLDIVMPVMDGFETLAQIRKDRRLRFVPVVVISALDELASAVRAIEAGAEDYLLKPFDPVLLRARLGALIEKVRLRNELSTQERLASMGTLAAGLAHEIKNPLNFVINFAELSESLVTEQREKLIDLAGKVDAEWLADMAEISTSLQQNLLKIREHGARADRIVNSMLAHSRRQPGERRLTDFNALVGEGIELAFHGCRAQGGLQAEVITDYSPSAGMVSVVPQDLSRVFTNVAANAFYSMRKKAESGAPGYKPVLRVSTNGDADHVEAALRDNGVGIPRKLLDRVFNPFFTTKPAGEGTGLGLSISYEVVVQEHHGEIRVDSEEGEYAEFRITIPRDPAGVK